MTDHLAVLEELAKVVAEMRDRRSANERCIEGWAARVDAAIALMRGQSETESTAIYLRKFDVTMIGQAKHAGQEMVSVLAKLHPAEGWTVRFNISPDKQDRDDA